MSVDTTNVDNILTGGGQSGAITRLYSKVSWRILPFLMLCYVVAFLDRINIGYAQLQMKLTLTFSDDLWIRRRHFLHRLLPLRGTEQPVAGADRRPQDAASHHVPVGRCRHRHGFRADADAVLPPALPARRARSRLLPGHYPVPDLLVSLGPPR